MRVRTTLFSQNKAFYIASLGYEDISENARWGRGRRNYYILHYVLAGEGFFNGHKVSAGNGFYISPGQLHEYHSSANAPWKYLWVIFGGEDASNLCKKYIKVDQNNVFEFDLGMDIRNLKDSMFSDYSPLSETKALSYFFRLLSLHERKDVPNGNRYVNAAKKYMDMHFCRNITVTEIAESIGINDRYLYNLFITHEKISPKQYLIDIRISKAKQHLTEGVLKITTISEECGFSSPYHFSHIFKEKTGLSPTEYMKQNKIFEI